MMRVKSTRGRAPRITAEAAILRGLAPDGGLYVPETVPTLPINLPELREKSYASLCARVLSPYFSQITEEELEEAARKAYTRFSIDPPVKLVGEGRMRVLELFHGPTLAFKDMALCLLPHLMRLAKKYEKNTSNTLLLTATSGDTGKAAMEGFADVEGFEVIVFYPLGGVSALQERQMRTQASKNTTAIGLEGNFDDAQRGVKRLLGSEHFRKRLIDKDLEIASANSINLGRLLAQIVYYIYAAVHEEGPLRFCVPTGNFGNVLAAHWARRMGAPIEELLVATNDNCVLDEFFRSGEYRADRELIKSHSPSMDILISSNLERLLAEKDASQVGQAMRALEETGHFKWSGSFEGFSSGHIREREVAEEIRRAWEEEGLLFDPHTAVASALLQRRKERGIVAATASAFKFPRFVLESLGKETGHDPFEDMKILSEWSGQEIPKPMQHLESAPIVQERTCRIQEMEETVWEVLRV